jgi:hypothetical protein
MRITIVDNGKVSLMPSNQIVTEVRFWNLNSPDTKDASPLIHIKYEKVFATRLRGETKCSLWRFGKT